MDRPFVSTIGRNRWIAFLLFAALAVTVWAVVTQQFELRRKAVLEPSVCIPVNTVITVTPDGGAGTCHDLQTAINAVVAPDMEIVVTAGTYHIPVLPGNSVSDIFINGKTRLNIHGDHTAGNNQTTLLFDQGNSGGVRLENSTGVRFEWFNISGTTANGLFNLRDTVDTHLTYLTMSDAGAHTFYQFGGSNTYLTNCTITSSAYGIDFENVTGISVGNCIITQSDNGLTVNNSSGRIFGNTIHHNRQSGVVIQNSTVELDQNTIADNGSASQNSAGISVSNVNGGQSTLTLHNTIILGNKTGILVDPSGSATIQASRNDLWNNTTNASGYTYPSGSNGNIASDPIFGGEYCLGTDSPVIYGTLANFEYMGSRGICSSSTTAPPNTPTATIGAPTPTATIPANTEPPVCSSSTIPPASGAAPLSVTLHGSGSAGNGPGLDGYRWDFDNNGSWDTGVVLDPVTHIYTAPGDFNPVYQVHGTNNVWSAVCNYPYTVHVTNGTSYPYTFEMLIRFAGVTDGKADGAAVTVRFSNGSLDLVTPPIAVTHTGNGNYKVAFTVPAAQLPPGAGYRMVIKGEKHVARRFCMASGQTVTCLPSQNITLSSPTTSTSVTAFNFTGLPLDPGDLNPQDGKADANDFAKIKERLNVSSPTAGDLMIADLNYDGIINIMDAFWMRKTLETRYDEN